VIRAAAIAALTLALAAPAARATDCRLGLLLALDVSSSVDPYEDGLQRNGLAAALLSPSVRRALFATLDPVALAVMEWSGEAHQSVIIDWIEVTSPTELRAVAATIATTQRSESKKATALGTALGFAHRMFDRAPDCWAYTLDVSGDGRNNDGPRPREAYARHDFRGITVNGLAIETSGTSGASLTAVDGDMELYYLERLIRGEDAFVEVAKGFEDFERAIRRKLERELAVAILGQLSQPSQ
jgi:hypothetical protein